MTTVFDHVHMDDLEPVLDKQGNAVYIYSGVPLLSINQKKARARLDALTAESIERRLKRDGNNTGAGEVTQAPN